MSRKEALAGGVFLGFYAALVVPPALWPTDGAPVVLVSYGLYVLLALGLASHLAELVLVAVWRPQPLPRALGPPARRRTAVLMTVCDDWMPAALEGLGPLAAAGYDVYLLDDSRDPVEVPASIAGQVTHVRRPGRTGAKAGNVNHWLWRFGGRYDHAILLDADSFMHPAAADALASSAAHPANRCVALFQSKVAPAPASHALFAEVLRGQARPRMAVLERVHAPLGLLLSFGHNQLLRLEALRSLGGLDEELAAEDTALSLELRARGWTLALVDVWSHDTEPATVATHNRRTIRWARQTVQLCGRSWTAVPLRLKLLLCRHLMAYAFLPAGSFLVGVSLWTGPRRADDAVRFMYAALAMQPGYAPYGAALLVMAAVYTLLFTLRIRLARREGATWRALALLALLGNAPYTTLVGPLAAAMVSTAAGRRLRFIPTNERQAVQADSSPWSGAMRWAVSAALLGSLAAGAAARPGSLLVGFNLIWLGLLALSPLSALVVNVADQRNRRAALDDDTPPRAVRR